MKSIKSRSELREIIIKVLYQIILYKKSNINFDLDNVISENIEQENKFVNDTISGILENNERLVSIANKYLNDWTIDRLSVVDQAILLLGIYELLYTDTPNIVCINEAIELSKKYSDEKVIKMINACLDKVYNIETDEQ